MLTTTRLTRGVTHSCGCDKEPLTYNSAHGRVERRKGRAANHSCVDCGKQAEEWSYNHQDPHELTGVVRAGGTPYEVVYSLNPDFYEPRCVWCHRIFDREPRKDLSPRTDGPLSIPDVAKESGIAEHTVRRAINNGRLAASRPGGPRGHFRIERADLEKWLESIRFFGGVM